MRVLRPSNGGVIELSDSSLLASGGEARVYSVPGEPSLVAKIYHKPTLERARKLRLMLDRPPADPAAGQKHNSIAWPSELLHSPQVNHRVLGFLMPRVGGMRRIIEYFNPKTRRQECPLFNYFYLTRTARNLVTAVRALHERGYVIGDVNESNILVSERALVTLVDTDSFQVLDPDRGQVFRCRVGKPEFTPPELQGLSFAETDRLVAHDQFGIGVVIFQLLMEGTHPFAGAYTGVGDPPPYEKRIASGHFPHALRPCGAYRPAPSAPSFGWLHPALQNLFVRCFEEGHACPEARPDPQAWQRALEEAEKSFATCGANEQHLYSNHLPACPWCERARKLGGRDPFPSLAAVKGGEHLRPAPRARDRSSRRTVARHGAKRVPIPRAIVISHTAPSAPATPARRKRPLPKLKFTWPHPPNYWAWSGLVISVSTAYFLYALPSDKAQSLYLFGILGLVAGAVGEVRAQTWDLAGKGKWPARASIALGSVDTLISLWFLMS